MVSSPELSGLRAAFFAYIFWSCVWALLAMSLDDIPLRVLLLLFVWFEGFYGDVDTLVTILYAMATISLIKSFITICMLHEEGRTISINVPYVLRGIRPEM